MGGGVADKDEDACTVMVYEQGVGWRTLPRYRYKWFVMAVLQDQLTLVGGREVFMMRVTNQISVWDSQQWTHPYPPMPTACYGPAVVTYINWLVVAGGSIGVGYLATVEIMNTTNKQWFTATPLPVGRHTMTSVVVGDECYFMGGFTRSTGGYSGLAGNKEIPHVSLPAITSQTVSQHPINPAQWHTLPDTPLEFSAPLALHGSLLALGGCHDGQHRSSAIHLYQAERRQWVKVGDLPTARSHCSCTLLPSGEILVAGGWDEKGRISRVDVATVD